MKALSVGIDFTPYVEGRAPGYNQYVKALLDGMRRMNKSELDLTIYIRHDQRQFFPEHERELKYATAKVTTVFLRVIWQNIVFPFIGRRHDVTIFTANIAPWFFFTKYLLVVHDLNFLKYPKNFSWLAFLYRTLSIKRSIQRADVCIAISNVVACEIWKYVKTMPVVISNPVIPCTAARSPVQSIPYEIVSISSAAKHKNLRQAYSAALRFADKRKDVIFYFAGPWRKEDFQSLGQHNNVRLLSYVSAERKVQLISRCAAFLVPSTYEGFGIPYVEAASCGVALICSDIDIAQEIVGDYFYPIKKPFGVTEIFDAIVEAYAQEFKPKSDGILIASRYDPKAVASRYMDEVRKIAEF